MWRVAAFISWLSIEQHLKTNYQHVQTLKRGVVTEKMTYIIDLIIPLWKKFISKATTAGFPKHLFTLEGCYMNHQDHLKRWERFIEAEGW